MRDKHRWIELGKDGIIVLLTLSAVWLLTMTPLVQDSGMLKLLSPQESPGAGLSVENGGTVMRPVRLAVTGEEGRYGVQYDEARLEELFPPLGALLGDALASAGEPASITEKDWQRYLGGGPNVYFDFQGEVPLPALERWLQGEGGTELTGSARRLLLCAGAEDQVLLCWQEAGSGRFFFCPTALTRTLHLDPAAEGLASNGAYFAFEGQGLTRLLDPYTLITEGEQGGAEYAVSVPLAGESGTAAVLEALSYNGQNHAPVSGGEVYLDGGDRLVVEDGGTVTYRAAQPEKYPVGPALADAVDGARALAERTLGTACGAARLYLMSAQEEDGALRVRFGYLLDGCAVRLGGEGWAAEFWVRDGYITQFTLRFRSYAANGGYALLLPIDKAAAMLPDLTDEPRELVLQYRDGGGGGLAPAWVAA
ncbi:MAG: hypothetical protein HDT38_00285 [Clostridiales bacterium]|nr:hypothetical protein [Clostridiales bacterium]